MSKHSGRPPFDLVQLSSLPQSIWLGLPIFHPCAQQNFEVGGEEIITFWQDPDYEENLKDPLYYDDYYDVDGTLLDPTTYDVGIVLSWETDPIFNDITRVSFLGNNGSILNYSSDNLWVPKVILKHFKIINDKK